MALLGPLVRFLFRWTFSWTGLFIFLLVTAIKRAKKFLDTLPTAVAVNFLRYISTTQPEPLRSKDWLSFYMLPPWVQTLCRVRALRKVLKIFAMKTQKSTYHILLTRTVFFDMHLQRLLTQCDREADDDSDPKASEPFAQFAIMGAGFDTRAYRFKQLLIDHETVPIEIDLPHMQKIKQQRLIEAAKTLSKEAAHRQLDTSHVRFVPTDFNLGELQKLLIDEGFQSHRKSIFLIEGVLGYLPPDVMDNTLRLLHFLSAPGSYLMCTIRVSPAPLANYQRSDPVAYKALLTSPAGEKKLVELGLTPQMARKYRRMYERGEPWLSSIPDSGPDSVQKFFDQFHLKVVEQMVPRDVYQKYCHADVAVADNENGREYEGSKFVVAMFQS